MQSEEEGPFATKEDKERVFCWGIKCPHLKEWTDDEGEWSTCTAKGCIYSKEFVKQWYKEHKALNEATP